ncbi:MAG: hypothetical protein WB766_12675 [Roseiarcus sp.]
MQIRLLLADKALEFGNARLGLREPVAGAAPPFHTARRPRRRLSPAIPIRR